MKRLMIAAMGLALLAAACGGTGARSLGPAPDGSPTPTPTPTSPSPTPSRPSPSPTETASGQRFTYEVWFAMGEHLFVAHRTEPFTTAVGSTALKALLAGPTSAEKAAGLTTMIPTGTSLRGLNIANGVATVDLTSTFDDGGGSLSERFRLAQVVYTITHFPTVQGVNFQMDGKAVTAFGGEGIVLDHPQTRSDYSDLLPAILVESPVIGQSVSSPVTVSGTANVFEATVSVWILDEHGTKVGDGFITATCGTGCRGTFSGRISYSVSHDQKGTVEVFESSAKDGSHVNVVKIPVTLQG
jgi:germination protein M